MNRVSWLFPGVEFVGICSRLSFLLPPDIYRPNSMTFNYNDTRSHYFQPLHFMESRRSCDFRISQYWY